MRHALYVTGLTIVGAASIVAGITFAPLWIGIAIWLLLNGYGFWFIVWIIFGAGLLSIAIGILRLPFLLVGIALIALSGVDPND